MGFGWNVKSDRQGGSASHNLSHPVDGNQLPRCGAKNRESMLETGFEKTNFIEVKLRENSGKTGKGWTAELEHTLLLAEPSPQITPHSQFASRLEVPTEKMPQLQQRDRSSRQL